MFVIGTAGHVDHGKSALVRALSGIDPDRWEEEKARGLTIDLGFAWTQLPSGREISIIDVPGHERFIRNMLAGIGGIDVALLVVAADEGVMPQTLEHLDILDLLDVRRGVIALAKSDLAEEEWRELVAEEVREACRGTALEDAPLVACSAVSGEGLEDLQARLDEAIDGLPAARDAGRPRMPIDRAFTISGFGTVVTGTLIDGRFAVGDQVVIEPAGARGRIRGIQRHEQSIESAEPGARTAINLGGIAAREVRRGMVLAPPGLLRPAWAVDVRLRVAARHPRPLRHNATLTAHCGSAEMQARVRLLEGDAVAPGEEGWAQLRLEAPLAAARGDRFVLRNGSETIAGGRIVDTQPRRHHRNDQSTLEALRTLLEGSADDALLTLLARMEPVAWSELAAKSELEASEAEAAMRRRIAGGAVVLLGTDVLSDSATLISDDGYEALQERARGLVQAHAGEHPLSGGLPREDLRSRLRLGPRPFAALEAGLIERGWLAAREGRLDLPGRQAELTEEQQRAVDSLLGRLREQGARTDVDPSLDADLVEYLAAQEQVVRMRSGVVLLREVYDEMTEQVRELILEQGQATLAEVRDRAGTSRKIAQALLEDMDQRRITRRVGDHRVLRSN